MNNKRYAALVRLRSAIEAFDELYVYEGYRDRLGFETVWVFALLRRYALVLKTFILYVLRIGRGGKNFLYCEKVDMAFDNCINNGIFASEDKEQLITLYEMTYALWWHKIGLEVEPLEFIEHSLADYEYIKIMMSRECMRLHIDTSQVLEA